MKRVWMVLLALLLACLAGCAEPAAAPASPAATSIPATDTPAPSTDTPVPPTPAVMPEQGTLEKGTITSPALAGNLLGDPDTRRYFIYLPPSYHVSDKRYPVVYMLHDNFETAELEQTGIRQSLDAMINAGAIGELIAVFPNAVTASGYSWYRSSPVIGDYETYVTQDLVDTIDASYRTIANPDSRAVASITGNEGSSLGAGANGALHLALTHPDVFGAAAAEYGLYDVENLADQALRKYLLAPQSKYPIAVANMISAIVSPNRDPLFQQVDGEWNIPADVREKIRLLNPVSDLEAYASQPDKLRGILIVQPASSGNLPAEIHGKPLDEAMTALGIDHEYVEYDGPYIAKTLQQMLLDFLAKTLVFEQE